MKQLFTLFLCCLLGNVCKAQFQTYASHQWNQIDSIPCPSDSNVMVRTLKHCQVYQTLDDTWYGVKDSTVCLNVIMTGFDQKIKLLGANPAKKVFVHWNLPDSLKMPLLENAVGKFELYFSADTSTHLNLNAGCSSGNPCTSVAVGIEIPDELNIGHNTRWYELPLTSAVNWNGIRSYNGNSCMPTEKFVNGNYLKEIIFSFSLQDTNLVGKYIALGSFSYQLSPAVTSWWQTGGTWANAARDTTIYVNPNLHHHTSYLQNIYPTGSSYGIFLFMYEDSTYPAPNALSFVEYSLSPNPSTQDTLDLLINMNETFVFQPFTAIRGGYVQGDSLRHIVNLYNNGAQLCIPGWIDIQILPKAGYIHQAGSLEFEDNAACMMLQQNSFLKVAEKGYLHYGQEGKGMLGVQTEAKIVVEKNATLVFDGKMILIPLASDTGRKDLEITLLPNSLLRFTENAAIINKCMAGFGRKIRVLMKGGFLDISKLSLDAQKHFELIYDEKPKSLEDNILILGNPFFETLSWQYIDDKTSEIRLNLMNIEGKIVQTYTFPTQKGINIFELNTAELPTGFYFLAFENQTGNVIRRIWKGE